MFKITIAPIAALVVLGSIAGGQGTARAPLAPTSKLWIEGTSNLHDWSCSSTTFSAAIELDSTAGPVTDALPKLLKAVRVKVPVRSLTCDHSGMNDNTYKALKSDKAPDITFLMTSFDTASATGPNAFVVKATGALSIAGKTDTVTLDVTGLRQPDGSIKATATVPIKMTDYGIAPPTAIFGTLKVHNEVNVKFDLTLGPTTVAAQPPK